MKTAEASSVDNSYELLKAISMSSWHHHGQDRVDLVFALWICEQICVCEPSNNS
jgi:hypothetical protein